MTLIPPTTPGLIWPAILAIALSSSSSHAGITADSIDACAQALESDPVSASPPLPSVLRLLSWNVMKFDLPGSREELQEFAASSDLIVLQESLRSASKISTGDAHRYFSPGYVRGSEETGVEIRSNQPADVICELQFMEPWLRVPKAALAVRLPFRDHAVLLINLHAINFTLTGRDYAAQLSALGVLVNSHEGPAIIAGDFNHWNGWRAGKLKKWAQDLGLTEVTFAIDLRSRHLGAAVDAIFLRGLLAIDETALPTTRSDHHPISASLTLIKDARIQEAGNLVVDASPEPGH